MLFTILGIGTGIVMLNASAAPYFIPAYIALGIAIDHNRKKATR